MTDAVHDHDGDLPDDWTDEQRALFSRVYRHMVANQQLFTHPAAAAVPDAHWNTTAWNAAWFATHASVSDAAQVVHCAESGEELGAEVPPGSLN